MHNKTSRCFHCGEPVPKGCQLTADIDGISQPMCCIGCQAVAEFLAGNDHDDFYRYRNQLRPGTQVEAGFKSWLHLDEPAVFADLTRPTTGSNRLITLKIEGMYCSACGWLIQKVLQAMPGVTDLQINSVTQNLQLEFDPAKLRLSDLFERIERLGYQPVHQKDNNNAADRSRKKQLKQIAVAGFGMMFIMTLAVPLYSPESFEVSPHIQRFFLLMSLLIATVVYFYAGQTFVYNAFRDIKNRHLGMDVPVALSISIAYYVSVYLSFKQQGHVYFDSMAMFIFFLLLGRYVESQVKHKGMDVRASLNALIPVSAERLLANDRAESIPIEQVQKGDFLRINANQVVPCDGEIISGEGRFDEALLTGESAPVVKQKGNEVYAGARLLNGPVIIRTTVNNQNTFLAKLADLMELAQSKKPKSLQQVDRIAGYFVAAVLLLATLTGLWYAQYAPELVLPVVLSLLIATCPCALSLATPTAMTAAGVKLLQHGILVNNTEAMHVLPSVDHWFFDKTGTLTEDLLSIGKIHNLAAVPHPENQAAGLQKISNHPLASAFRSFSAVAVEAPQEYPGRGVAGVIDNQLWRMGSAEWLQSLGIAIPEVSITADSSIIYLSCEQQVLSVFELAVLPRNGAGSIIDWLLNQSKKVTIISGDQTPTVAAWAKQLNISDFQGDMQAQDKISAIESAQQQGQQCAMVGDGVNDAPVLSQADVSISLKQGAHLAHSASDLIILGRSLKPIKKAVAIAAQTQRIVRQNLIWALLYNGTVAPVAMMGLLAPWMAAIGMSASSLMVVLNSRRILKK